MLPELEPLAGGVLEPLAAPLDGVDDELDAPPEAESFFVASADEEELEDDGGVLGVVLTEPDVELEPDGAVDGVVVEPADEDDAPG